MIRSECSKEPKIRERYLSCLKFFGCIPAIAGELSMDGIILTKTLDKIALISITRVM